MKIMTGKTLLAACMLAWALGGCGGEVVDTGELPPLTGYTDWYRVDASGEIAGHGDTYRIIYGNDRAREYGHAGAYRTGTVLVKEIRALGEGGLPGDILYYAVMRKLDQAPPGGTLEGGWQFTMFTELGGAETQNPVCWDTCHVQAPMDGAWFDYGR